MISNVHSILAYFSRKENIPCIACINTDGSLDTNSMVTLDANPSIEYVNAAAANDKTSAARLPKISPNLPMIGPPQS